MADLGFTAGSGLVFTNATNNDTFLLINNSNGDLIQAPAADIATGQGVQVVVYQLILVSLIATVSCFR